MSSVTRSRVLLFGYFGFGNAGDDAICMSILRELNRIDPTVSFSVTCNDCAFLKAAHNLNISACRWNPLSIVISMTRCDVFIFAGGTHFHDHDRNRPRRFSILAALTILCLLGRLLGKPPHLLNHGIGPLRTRWGRFLLRLALLSSASVSVRDRVSAELVKSLTPDVDCFRGFDSAILLFDQYDRCGPNPSGGPVGIAIAPAGRIYNLNKDEDSRAIHALSESFLTFDREMDSISFRVFVLGSGRKDNDFELAHEIARLTRAAGFDSDISAYDGNLETLFAGIAQCRAMICGRYHAMLFSFGLGVPFISLESIGKNSGFIEYIGGSNRAILDEYPPNKSNIVQSLGALLEAPDTLRPKLTLIEAHSLARDSIRRVTTNESAFRNHE